MDKFIDEIIHHNSGYMNTNLKYNNNNNSKNISFNNTNSIKVEEDEHRHKVDNIVCWNKYYLNDLFNNKLFSNLCKFHLIPICGDKFLFINIFNLMSY